MPSDKGVIALPSQIYHVGVVVEDIVKSTDFLYSMWGISPWDIMDYTPTKAELMMGEPYKIKVSAAWLGPTQLEFLQPVEGKSIYSEFISTKGEGLHHLAFNVPNWDGMVAKLPLYPNRRITRTYMSWSMTLVAHIVLVSTYTG